MSRHITSLGNDPDLYRPGGELLEALKNAQPLSDVDVSFSSVTHGWVVRGDVTIPTLIKTPYDHFKTLIKTPYDR